MAKVKINQGVLVGGKSTTASGHEYFSFLEIPYAEPPIGKLRFKSPVPPKPWDGERNAKINDPKHISQQFNMQTFELQGSEDCLYLNVHTPKLPVNKTTDSLPVIVYIHGGGFVTGSGTAVEFNIPDQLIEHDVVIVTINYRLNVFGFLSLDLPEAAGNMGLKDQVFALKWVQENILAFGGDPKNVTICGLSAGAASIDFLLLSQRCKGLFAKAILQSGSSLNHWAIQYNILDLSVKLARNLGYTGDETDMKAIHSFLMSQTSEALGIKANETIFASGTNGLNFGFVPSIEKDFGDDDAILTQHPYNLLDDEQFIEVPTIRGFCEMEGLISEALNPKAVKKLNENKRFTDFWKYPMNPNDIEHVNKKLHEEYFGGKLNEEDIETGIVEFLSHHDFTAGVITATQKTVLNGAIPTYLYMFAFDSPSSFIRSLLKRDRKGASHGADIGHTIGVDVKKIFGEVKSSETDVLISKRMSKMWTNFAKTGNPTPTTDDLIPLTWPVYNNEDQQFLVIDEQLRIDNKYQPSRMAIFEEIYEKYRK